MGLFDAMYKKPIPKYARKIGIVTASSGAAVRDIIQIAKRRNPFVELFLYPALVQGEGAVASICKGIARLDQMGLDVLIVGRGGGSIEDLWAFNEEAVAKAIFNADTPIISAVGHETDTTIADFVSDLRAPTPSAAAELAVFDYMQFVDDLASYTYSFHQGWSVLFRKCVKGLRRRSFVFPSFTQGTFYRENSIEFWIWKVVFKGRWNYVFRKINRRFFPTGYSPNGWSESLQMPRTGWESIRSFPTR